MNRVHLIRQSSEIHEVPLPSGTVSDSTILMLRPRAASVALDGRLASEIEREKAREAVKLNLHPVYMAAWTSSATFTVAHEARTI